MPPKRRANVSDLVGERDQHARREFDAYLIISAVRVFVRMRGARSKGSVKLFENPDGALIDAAEHDAIRIHELLHGFAFGEKFGIHSDPEVEAGFLAGGGLERRQHVLIRRAGHNTALYHDDVIAGLSRGARRRFERKRREPL